MRRLQIHEDACPSHSAGNLHLQLAQDLVGVTCRFVIIPDMLKNAPMFKRIDPKYRVSHIP